MNKNPALKSGWRLYPLFTALLIIMAACGPDPFFIPVRFIEGVPETGRAGTPLILTGTVSPSFASNNVIVWLVEDAGTTGASISGNILNTQANGTVSIKAIIPNGIAEGKNYTQNFIILFTDGAVVAEPITNVALTVTGPVKNGTPDTTAAGSGHYTAGAVSWSPDDNPFKGGTAYTATVILTADTGYTFAGLAAAAINGNDAVISGNAGTTVTLSHTFTKTLDKEITGIAIKTQPAKLTYIHGDTLDLSGLVVTLIFDTGSPEDAAYSNFDVYNISAAPAQGTKLTVAHNGLPVTVSVGDFSAVTSHLTVNKANAPAVSFPTAAAITYGAALSTSSLSGGTTGRGSFHWQSPATIPPVTNNGYPVEFTPTDTDIYDYTGINGWNGAKVVRTVSVTVNKKSIVIAPTSELSKVYNAPPNPDPTFTYTSSPALISGDAFSGALGREAGENAGTYAITPGTLTAGDNYTLSLAGSVVFTINKAAGTAVTVPAVEGDNTAFTIKVTAPSALSTATGQSIEYAISTSNSASPASLTWAVDKYTFAGADVAIDTAYYVYARSKENANYNAGTPSVSAEVGIYPTGSAVTISFAQISDDAPNITGPALTLSRSADDGHPKHITLTIEGSGYDSISWEITGTGFTGQGITGTGASFRLDAADARYNQDGDHHLTLIVYKGGIPYNKTVIFTIVP
jgi:hypothetical protein